MKSNYKPIGNYIKRVEKRNTDLKVTKLLGLSMTKEFRETTSNIVGTDMSVYRVMNKWQFACDFMSPIRVNKLPVVLKTDDEPNLVSPAYPVFEVKDKNELDPEYLMMWFRRSEFDRYAAFKCDSAIRGGYDWDELCNTLIPVPKIETQKEIVAEYNTIVNRINLNNQLIQKLEETAQAIYKQWFVEGEDISEKLPIESYIESANTGLDAITRAPIVTEDTGVKCLRIQDISQNKSFNNWGFTSVEANNYNRFQLKKDDIIIARTGATVGVNLLIMKDYKAVYNNGLIRIRVDKSKIYPCILNLILKTKEFIEYIDSISCATSTQPNIQIGELIAFKIPLLPFEKQKEIADFIGTINEKIFNYKNQVIKLEELKDLLLSKLATIESAL
jgi:type I restriction enzyme S subunit